MRKILLCILHFAASYVTALGQDIPTPIVGHPFAKPGVTNSSPGRALSIEYERQPNYELKGGIPEGLSSGPNDVERKERFEAKIKIPFFLKGNWKVLGDIYYSSEKYTFTDIQPEGNYAFRAIDGEALKRSRGTLYIFRSMSPKYYLAMRLENSYNGNFDGFVNFDRRFAVYRGALLLGKKQREDNEEMALGLLFSNSFGRNTVYPFALYNRTFNDKWGIETVLPVKLSLRRNFNEKNLLLLSAEYWSSAYSVKLVPPGSDPLSYYFKSSAIQFFLDWQKNLITSWTWVSLKAGYSWNFDSKFVREDNRNDVIDAFPSRSIFFSAAFFLSPPKKFMESNTRTN